MRRYLLAAIAAASLLAGCGGTHTITRIQTISLPKLATRAAIAAHTGHPCSTRNQTMECVLASQPEPKRLLFELPAGQLYGIDFGWQGISASHAQELHARFAISYLSDSSKDWTRGLLDDYHRAGIATVAVWETSGTRALDGCDAGRQDAQHAAAELKALGAPAGQPFTMAIDFDAESAQLAQIGAYFRCASNAEPGRVNAYGSAYAIDYLHANGVVGNLNFVTYAWLYRTNGQWPPTSVAPLQQYLNGSSFDNDRALAANYGQWPYTAPRPRPTIHSKAFRIYPLRRFRIHGHKLSERRTVVRWRAHDCQNPVHRRVCVVTRRELRWESQRLVTLARRRHNRLCINVAGCGPDIWHGTPYHWSIRHYRIERILTTRRHHHR